MKEEGGRGGKRDAIPLGACAFAMHVGTSHIFLVVPDLETQNSSRTSLTLPSSSPRTGPPSRSPTPPRLLATPVCSSLDHLPHHVHTPFRCPVCGFTTPACGFTTPTCPACGIVLHVMGQCRTSFCPHVGIAPTQQTAL